MKITKLSALLESLKGIDLKSEDDSIVKRPAVSSQKSLEIQSSEISMNKRNLKYL